MGDKPWKAPPSVSDLAGACTFNSMFFTLALIDYSADLWALRSPEARLSFIVDFVLWRGDAPIISKMLLVLLLPLPLIIVGILYAALQTLCGWRRASLSRHMADVAEAAGICSIVFMVVTRVIPVQGRFLEACRSKEQRDACSTTLAEMAEVHLVMVLLNLLMFVCPIVKFARSSVPESEKTKAA
uniref:G-protein coupled receptors family 1 profile domain-containing protein n=1 Tax=Coccolithus braarudii TaxID=221442 RepID=A0A7S0LKK9_9EUKA|mmetsp:Transcript_45650/g.97257  ORF Transcript_45650/g.97257 Transcript_45650/m.97257 type:complete len:185 (+) Transcript_45650:36-590(+)